MSVGKQRTPYGEFMDKRKILQERVAEVSGLNRDTVSRAFNDLEYNPRKSVQNLLLLAARILTGEKVQAKEFW